MMKMKSRDEYDIKPLNKIDLSKRGSDVLSTSQVSRSKCTESRQPMINQYMILKTLGEGSFGKVKLCIDSISN